MICNIIKLTDNPDLKGKMALWFHEKWGIALDAYLESMEDAISTKSAFPEWYAVLEGDTIIGGAGVIENDFHSRRDLYPNVCALFVEETHRGRGIAGELLEFICTDMKKNGIDTLYLLTDHTSFYERYGWSFLCMAQGDGEEAPSRMYIKQS